MSSNQVTILLEGNDMLNRLKKLDGIFRANKNGKINKDKVLKVFYFVIQLSHITRRIIDIVSSNQFGIIHHMT